MLLREPEDRQQLIALLHSAFERNLLDADALSIIEGALAVSDMQVGDVMVPRAQMHVMSIDDGMAAMTAMAIETAHSRFPVTGEDKDDVIGVLLAKDLLRLHAGENVPLRDMLRPAVFIPETKRLNVLLREFRASRNHMAIVVDEYGGTAGLLTIENLIEEIVGDIQDEYDLNEEADYVADGPDAYMIDAGMNLDDVNELLDVDLPTEDSSTLGGFIYSRVGRVPTVGEVIRDEENQLTLRVESVDGRRIRKVRVERQRPADDEAAPPADGPAEANPRHLDKAG